MGYIIGIGCILIIIASVVGVIIYIKESTKGCNGDCTRCSSCCKHTKKK